MHYKLFWSRCEKHIVVCFSHLIQNGCYCIIFQLLVMSLSYVGYFEMFLMQIFYLLWREKSLLNSVILKCKIMYFSFLKMEYDIVEMINNMSMKMDLNMIYMILYENDIFFIHACGSEQYKLIQDQIMKHTIQRCFALFFALLY